MKTSAIILAFTLALSVFAAPQAGDGNNGNGGNNDAGDPQTSLSMFDARTFAKDDIWPSLQH
jgi:hypothetical protein